MTVALNLTAPLKQDEESQRQIRQLADDFATEVQPAVDRALAESHLVHFARVLVIDGKYIQVLTEFDGDPVEYTDFFRLKLGPVFKKIFSLVEGAPPWEKLDTRDAFHKYTSSLNLKALGRSGADGEPDRGFLFRAYGDATVKDIQEALGGRADGRAPDRARGERTASVS